MPRIRRCDSRCHNAKGTHCLCWCQGRLHGKKGAALRQAVRDGGPGILESLGFIKGKTAYLDQTVMDLPDGTEPAPTPFCQNPTPEKSNREGLEAPAGRETPSRPRAAQKRQKTREMQI